MKLAISNIAWSSEFDTEVLEYLQEKGIKGLEIAPTRIISKNPYLHLDNAKQYREFISTQYNLEVVSLQSIWFGRTENMFDSYDDLATLLDYTYKSIVFASTVGSKNLVFGSPKNRNIGSNAIVSLDDIYSFFYELGEYCKKYQTVLSIEPNPTIYGTNFINTTKEALDIVKHINHPNIKVNLDLGTVIENNEDIKAILAEIDYIHHVHISEPYLEAIAQRSIHSELLQELAKKNYKGFISIEMKNLDSVIQVKTIVDYIDSVFMEVMKEM